MKKILFAIKVNNVVDVITNSSSELFVLKGETKNIVEEMITNIYPNYKNEYEEVKHISELTTSELNTYFDQISSEERSYNGNLMSTKYSVPDGFSFDEIYERQKDWRTGEIKEPDRFGNISYTLRNNSNETWGSFVTEDNIGELIKRLDPKGELYFLFSLDENPDWELQEKLMNIADRYHLG